MVSSLDESKEVIDVSDRADTDNEKKIDPRNKLNELTAKEWIVETVSVWNQRGLGVTCPRVWYHALV